MEKKSMNESLAKLIVRELFSIIVCAPIFAALSLLLLACLSHLTGGYSYSDKLTTLISMCILCFLQVGVVLAVALIKSWVGMGIGAIFNVWLSAVMIWGLFADIEKSQGVAALSAGILWAWSSLACAEICVLGLICAIRRTRAGKCIDN